LEFDYGRALERRRRFIQFGHGTHRREAIVVAVPPDHELLRCGLTDRRHRESTITCLPFSLWSVYSPTAPMRPSVLPRRPALPLRSFKNSRIRSAFQFIHDDGLSNVYSLGLAGTADWQRTSKPLLLPPKPSSTRLPSSCSSGDWLALDEFRVGLLARCTGPSMNRVGRARFGTLHRRRLNGLCLTRYDAFSWPWGRQ
jgi:hypothetical protein